MTGLVLERRPSPDQSRADDAVVWGPTHLRVTDLDRALGFWEELLGMTVLSSGPDGATLGVEDAALVVLHPGATEPTRRGHTGLYHVALHLPTANDFAALLARFAGRGIDPSPTDHLLHWAMYLWDEDGIGVELSFETADRFDRVETGTRPLLVGTDGRLHGPVEPLDVGTIMGALGALDQDSSMPAGTRVGHNHLHVSDLKASTAFYEKLGFSANPSFMQMVDFNAGGSFAHRLAVNEWQGHGAPPPPSSAAGLHHLELSFAEEGELQSALARLGDEVGPAGPDGRFTVSDPSGNPIELGDPT